MNGLAKTQSNSYRYKKKHFVNTPSTPMTPAVFSMRTFRINNVFFSSQNVLQQVKRTCQVCGFDDISSYCQCRDRFYHEACLKRQIIEDLPRLKEVAFLCQYCLQFYKFKAEKTFKVDPQGKRALMSIFMLLFICVLTITLVLLLIENPRINDFFICSIVFVSCLIFCLWYLYYNYVHLWLIRWSLCVFSDEIKFQSIKQVIPYLLANRFEYICQTEKNTLQVYSHPPPQVRLSISLDEVREQFD